ncbi:hypothetical protein FRB94_011447 [Tulasnella sp. JGI-2019a]|nr:hypothetical protein FRB94_011447 [Tulasnella sp. JGI-2019a]
MSAKRLVRSLAPASKASTKRPAGFMAPASNPPSRVRQPNRARRFGCSNTNPAFRRCQSVSPPLVASDASQFAHGPKADPPHVASPFIPEPPKDITPEHHPADHIQLGGSDSSVKTISRDVVSGTETRFPRELESAHDIPSKARHGAKVNPPNKHPIGFWQSVGQGVKSYMPLRWGWSPEAHVPPSITGGTKHGAGPLVDHDDKTFVTALKKSTPGSDATSGPVAQDVPESVRADPPPGLLSRVTKFLWSSERPLKPLSHEEILTELGKRDDHYFRLMAEARQKGSKEEVPEQLQRLRDAAIRFAYEHDPFTDLVKQQVRRYLKILAEYGDGDAENALKAMGVEPETALSDLRPDSQSHHGKSQPSVAKDTETKGKSLAGKEGVSKGEIAALVTGILAVGATGGVAVDRAVGHQDSQLEASLDSGTHTTATATANSIDEVKSDSLSSHPIVESISTRRSVFLPTAIC